MVAHLRLLALVAAGAVALVLAASGSAGRTTTAQARAVAVGGTQLWAAHSSGAALGYGRFVYQQHQALSPDGKRLYVAGASADGGGAPVYTTWAYNAATGGQLWETKQPYSIWSTAEGVVVSPDGGKVYVTGCDNDGGGYVTVAYDAATGAQLWVAKYVDPYQHGTGRDIAESLALSPDGATLYVTGVDDVHDRHDETRARKFTTIAYNAATGAGLWIAVYHRNGEWPVHAALALQPDGSRLFVSAFDSLADRYLTVAYDTTSGVELWQRAHTLASAPEGNNVGSSVAASPDGSQVFVTGAVFSPATLAVDVLTTSYDTETGHTLWRRRFDGMAHGDDVPRAITVSPDGAEVAVVGETGESPDSWAVVYQAATGKKIWTRYRTASSGVAAATSAAFSGDSARLYVTGESGGDMSTVAYESSSGTKRWAAGFHATGNESIGDSVVVAPDGTRVYVAGRNGLFENVTVAYQAS